jgi:hypothetical protein
MSGTVCTIGGKVNGNIALLHPDTTTFKRFLQGLASFFESRAGLCCKVAINILINRSLGI